MQAIHPQLAEAFALSQAGRQAEALATLERVAAAGDPEALFVLADAHWRGTLVPRDFSRGRDLFGQAGAAGHPIASRACTNLLASGHAGTRDWRAALVRLRAEARDDVRRGQMLRLIETMALTPEGDPRSLPPGRRLSDSPDVVLFPGLFTAAECDFLTTIAEPTYAPSMVGDADTPDRPDPFRTSDGSTMHWLVEDPATHALNRRLAALSGTHFDQGEPLQILRYRPGQEYRRHLDFIPGVQNQRMLTALVYLNTDYTGGETCFVKTDLKVKGHKGDGLLFRNSTAGRADPMSEHAGMPVLSGTKYLASRWIRERRNEPD